MDSRIARDQIESKANIDKDRLATLWLIRTAVCDVKEMGSGKNDEKR